MCRPATLGSTYRFGRFELDPATRQLLADGGQVTLGARAFDVLVALVEHRDRLVTKDELLEIAWPGLVVEENNLQVQVSALRKILGQQAIATVPGRGYRFAPALESDAPTAAARAADAPERKSDSRQSAQPDSKSVAVLPFANLSDDKDNAYFADGIHEDLLTQLSLLGDLKVVSRTSVMGYRDTTKNVRQVAAELGVATLVEGSVRRAGNQVRVTAQLIDARSDNHLWAKSYDRKLKDIFAIQTELATEIARSLKASLSPLEEKRLASKPTANLEAYELLLRARERAIRAFGTWEPVDHEIIKLLTRAVELDPEFALAWARLGAAHALMYINTFDASEARKAMATQAMDRALQIAPEDIEVQIEAGNVRNWAQRDFHAASQAFQNVLRLTPNNVDALLGLYNLLALEGLVSDATSVLERLLAIDPRNDKALVHMVVRLQDYRHFDRALAMWQRVISIRPESISEQVSYYGLEYLKTGSWESYDQWRAALPEGTRQQSPDVWFMDVECATCRSDFAAVVRLCEHAPEWFRKNEWGGEALRESRVLVALASGDRVRAGQLARVGLKDIEATLASRPSREASLLRQAAMFHAVLAEREAALANLRRAKSSSRIFVRAVAIDQSVLAISALLGDRASALSEMRRQVKLPYSQVHRYRTDLSLASLWDDPEFLAIVNDPANNAPLPLDLKYEFFLDKEVR